MRTLLHTSIENLEFLAQLNPLMHNVPNLAANTARF